MKKLIVIGIVMVMGLAVAASAAPFVADNTIKMGLKFENVAVVQAAITVGTTATAADGYVVGEDLGQTNVVGGAGEVDITDLGTGTFGGRWGTDYRNDLTAPGQVAVWHLTAYINGGAASSNVGIKAWMTSTGKLDSTDYVMKLYSGTWSGAEVLANGSAITTATLWTAPYLTSGTSSTVQYTGERTALAAGASKYYTVALYTPVPEPGSMVALFSGLVGLVGFGIRRRK